ncbi:MAG: hypothetical protein DRP87_04555 [Spirochaetes bacterium]|nr:MAG: hypothetical protein DRP87_04555 [Spirochaetota bacterium]
MEILSLLGLDPAEALKKLGPPAEVFPLRGDEESQDDVVFYYDNHLYLFWYNNRVWQVRLDRRFEGAIAGISMGDSKEKIIDILGKPFYCDSESCIFLLPDKGYPVRARLFFNSDSLYDAYIYRSDF